MIKLVVLVKKKDDLTYEQFVQHWKDVHIPLVVKLPGLLRYHITPVSSFLDREDRPFDGIGELYFRDEESLSAALASVETAATAEDGRLFITRGGITRLTGYEEVIIDGQE